VVLLASRETTTLSILSLQLGSGDLGRVEEGGILSLIIMAMSLGLALPMRMIALRMGVRENMHV
jgi:ABC-type Fe3+ transport system permease subunit